MAKDDRGTVPGGSAPAAKRGKTVSERIAELEAEIQKRGSVTMAQSNELSALRTQLKLQGE